MQPVEIPVSRYLDADFAALEDDRLWPRVWQFACSVDHVAAPGDYYEHRIGRLSILVVRGDEAAHFRCRHVQQHCVAHVAVEEQVLSLLVPRAGHDERLDDPDLGDRLGDLFELR